MPTDIHTIRPARQYTAAIERSNHFLEAKSALTESEPVRRAYGAAALRFVAEREAKSEYLDIDTQAVRLVGLLEDFTDSERAMDDIYTREADGERIDRSDKIPHLTQIVRFNHAIRELIDTQPELTTDDLLHFVGDVSLQLDGPDTAAYVIDKLRRKIVGMQHEIVAEQALWTIDGVEDIIHATEEEELHGIDMKVIYKGVTVNLDIKASQGAEIEAQKRYSRTKKVAWSGVTQRDLKHRFRAAPETVATAADHLQEVLDQVIEKQRMLA